MDVGEFNSVVFELGIRDTRALAVNFHKADVGITDAMKSAVASTLAIFDRVWESLTPVDTGWMVEHRHIRLTPSGLGFDAGWDASDFLGQGLAFYPFFQEFGTRFMNAQPSLGPAYEYIVPEFKQNVSDILRATIAALNMPVAA
jgi:HK97 gp10 family phage protein